MKDEKKEKTFQVEAYDETGEAHLMKVGLDDVYHANSGESVTRPIIVLAVNERTDAEGNVLPAYQKEMTVTPPGDGGGEVVGIPAYPVLPGNQVTSKRFIRSM